MKPDKCIKCGAVINHDGIGWVDFKCGSLLDIRYYNFIQSETCKVAENYLKHRRKS